MKGLDKIIYTGLWTQPVAMGIELKLLSLQDSGIHITGQTLISMTALSLLPAFYIYMSNNLAYWMHSRENRSHIIPQRSNRQCIRKYRNS